MKYLFILVVSFGLVFIACERDKSIVSPPAQKAQYRTVAIQYDTGLIIEIVEDGEDNEYLFIKVGISDTSALQIFPKN